MRALATAFMQIALHRRGPESLPASVFLFFLLLAAYIPAGLLVLGLRDALSARQFAIFAADTALYLAFVFAVLRFFKLERRFLQTGSALLGTDIFINAVSLPLALYGQATGADMTGGAVVWIYLGLLLWWIDVAGFVLSRALSQPYIVGLMFVILYVMTSFSIQDAFTQTST